MPGKATSTFHEFKAAKGTPSGAARFCNFSSNGRWPYWRAAPKENASAPLEEWRAWLICSRIEAERGRAVAAVTAYRKARSLNPLGAVQSLSYERPEAIFLEDLEERLDRPGVDPVLHSGGAIAAVD